MADIFNLFSDKPSNKASTFVNHRGPLQNLSTPFSKPNSSTVSSAKTVRQSGLKPKGLSVRSQSDLNISVNSGIDTKNLIVKSTQIDINGAAISPRSKKSISKKLNPNPIEIKGSSLKQKSPNNQATDSEKLLNFENFKKPSTPIKMASNWPKPEKLANYYDFEHEMNDYDYVLDHSVWATKSKTSKEFEPEVEEAPLLVSFPMPPRYVMFDESIEYKIEEEDVDLPEILDVF